MQFPQQGSHGRSSRAQDSTGWQGEPWGWRVTEWVHRSPTSGCSQGPIPSPHSILCYLCWSGRRTPGCPPRGEKEVNGGEYTHDHFAAVGARIGGSPSDKDRCQNLSFSCKEKQQNEIDNTLLCK